MSHGPEHQIEHAEHASHAAHNHFDRRVTISIAIVAAVLACVTMLGHRSHNETLRLQGEALTLQTDANIKHTEGANKWAFYQAQNIRSHQYRAMLNLLDVLPTRDGSEARQAKVTKDWQGQVDKYEANLPKIKEDAEALDKESQHFQKESAEKLKESHELHAKADRFDYGELGLQLGVVLCSLAILTKNRAYWFVGIAASLLGALTAISGLLGLFMAHH
jgi:hypothetical protein